MLWESFATKIYTGIKGIVDLYSPILGMELVGFEYFFSFEIKKENSNQLDSRSAQNQQIDGTKDLLL